MKKSQLIGLSLLAAMAMPQSMSAEATLYAYQYNSVSRANVTGLYSMKPDGSDRKLLWEDTYSSEKGCNMVSGWMRDGKLCGIVSLFNALQVDNSMDYYVERDLLTGEVLKEVKLNGASDNWTNFYVQAAYCPFDDFVYGYGINTDRSAFAFKKAPATALNETVIVKEGVSYTSGTCFNDDYGVLAGVLLTKNADLDYSASFIQIDINTGATKTSESFNLKPNINLDYKGVFGLVWNSATQSYLWNCYNQEGYSIIYEIDPQTKTCSEYGTLPDEFWGQFFILEGDEPTYSASAPSAVSDMYYTKTETSATVTFKLPSMFSNGTTSISENVNYTVYEGSRKLTSGSGAPGSEVTTPALPLSEGTHFLRIVPEIYGVDGVPAVLTVVMGVEVPSSPLNVNLTETTLTWDPVTTGQHGATLTGVTYSIDINGRTVGTTDKTTFDVSEFIDANGVLSSYVAAVSAVCDGAVSKPTESNRLIAGKPWTPPFEVTPDKADFSLCTLQDVDGDGSNWSLYTRSYDNEPVFLSGNNAQKASEDWLFFPAFTGSRTSIYNVSMTVSLAQQDLPNGELQVWIGTSPEKEGMKRCLIPAARITEYDPIEYYADFMIDGELADASALYLGVVVSSREKENSPVMINNVKVTEVASDLNRPSAVTELKAELSETAPDMATVSFRFPETLLDGTSIAAGTEMSARVAVIGMQNTTVKGTPGEAVTVDVNGYSGYNVIVVTPQIGSEKGLGSDVVCHLGFGRPGPVRNIRISYPEDDLGFRVDWDDPDTDYFGKPSQGGTFSYKIWQRNSKNEMELVREIPIGYNFADVTMSENFDLVNLEVGITAINNEGEGPLTTFLAQIGDPYKMPLNEDFNGETYTYEPLTPFTGKEYVNVEYKWGAPSKLDFLSAKFNVADAGDVIAVYPNPEATEPAVSRLWLPKFASTGYTNVDLILYVWTGSDAAETSVTGWAYGMDEPEVISTLPRGKADGYEKIPIHLPEKMWNKSWIQIAINSSYPSINDRFVMAGYEVQGQSGVDGVADSILGTIKGGDSRVTLFGFKGQTAEVYTLDGRKTASVEVGSDIFSFPMEKGFYVVKVGNQSAKVSVR